MPTDVCVYIYIYVIVMKSINEFFRQKDFDCKFLSFKLPLKVLLQSGGKEITQDQPWS